MVTITGLEIEVTCIQQADQVHLAVQAGVCDLVDPSLMTATLLFSLLKSLNVCCITAHKDSALAFTQIFVYMYVCVIDHIKYIPMYHWQ